MRVPDRGPAPVAAGPTAGEALCLARELGHGEGGQAEQATADDLDSLDLPPSALGIPSGAAPWWREADPNPLVPDRIDLDRRSPVYYLYHAVEGPDSPIGATVHAWGEVEADEFRRHLGTGRLVGWLRRERAINPGWFPGRRLATRIRAAPASPFESRDVLSRSLRKSRRTGGTGPRLPDPADSRHATAPRPFFATSVRSFNDAPRGRFSPRSHWLTSPVVTLR